MKTSVLDFIESKTLRQHLSGQTLAPAVECILIAQCHCRSLEDKIEALQERYDNYSTEDFTEGKYHCGANNFKAVLNDYIVHKKTLLDHYCDAKDSVYLIETDHYPFDMSIFDSAERALITTKQVFENICYQGIDYCTIAQKRINAKNHNTLRAGINENCDIYDVYYPENDDIDSVSMRIEQAYAEIPHPFLTGDIVRYCGNNELFVVAEEKQAKRSLFSRKKSGICLSCLRYVGFYEIVLLPIERMEISSIKDMDEDIQDCSYELENLSGFLKSNHDDLDFFRRFRAQ